MILAFIYHIYLQKHKNKYYENDQNYIYVCSFI